MYSLKKSLNLIMDAPASGFCSAEDVTRRLTLAGLNDIKVTKIGNYLAFYDVARILAPISPAKGGGLLLAK
jgi:hypothetical protein